GDGTKRRDRASATAESEDAPWSADSDFRGGTVVITNEPIAGTEKDALFQTQRAGDGLARGESFVYAIPVPEDAIFRVRLYFAEVEYGVGESPKKSKGKRVFNVDAEGERALQDLDIAAEVGPATALVKMFDIEVDDVTLELEFIAEKAQPTLAAIAVLIPRSAEQKPPSRKNDRGAVPPGEPRERFRRARLRRQWGAFGTS
ncbi:MAG: malectin domain-containing carbohydrate-binding protein, partial [Chloroflexota bacterium]